MSILTYSRIIGGLLPAHLSFLPVPSDTARAHSTRLSALIASEISAAGGWINFARFMELALHAPGLGYYSAGARKFGSAGDFVTAPELGRLFATTLARQCAECLRNELPTILEIGAGSGRLACDLLAELASLECLPQRYLILETSADLRERQRNLVQRELPHLASKVSWLSELPTSIEALVIGNEVLDAMPVHLFTTGTDGVAEIGVIAKNHAFEMSRRPAGGRLRAEVNDLQLEAGYTSEIHLASHAFVRTMASHLARGVIMLIDYGFPAHEYYHPQRSSGTLMCHYRQHAHDDPLHLVGLQDITAHVDFTAISRVAAESGLDLLGYAGQAQFLINCGITDVLAAVSPSDTANYLPLAAQAQKLMSPAEMGELFKIIAFGKDYDQPLLGFLRGDKRHTL